MGFSIDRDAPGPDPFAVFVTPPPNETADEKARREARDAEARRVSEAIDEELRKERAALKKEKATVKLLLLGQSESGKSTTLKNFRMHYAPSAWKAERESWRSVIQLNLIRSVNAIVKMIDSEMKGVAEEDYDSADEQDTRTSLSFPFTDRHRLLCLRLRPLTDIERDLKRRMGASAEEIVEPGSLLFASPFDAVNALPRSLSRPRSTREFSVRSWKNALTEQRPRTAAKASAHGHVDARSDEVTEVIATCREDMKEIWSDRIVHAVLRKRNVRLQDSAGFFLDDIDRIATRGYEPSDDDIVRARLRTLGVQEHRLTFEHVVPGSEIGHEWALYDVGGSRTMRAAWLPYFENVHAIIFLAPISCFDEHLAEDSKVNRLEDSFILWRAVCSSKLLTKTILILFLNKCDILDRKLKSGIIVKTHLLSYGDRPNDSFTVKKYLRNKFKDIQTQNSPESRPFYAFATSVIDTRATATTLQSVRDGILMGNLKQANFV